MQMSPDPMQQQQQQQMQQAQGGDYNARLGVVEARLGSLFEMVEAFGKKLDARSTFNWAPINIMLVALGMVGGLFFTWVNTNNSRFEAILSKIEVRQENFATRNETDARFSNSAIRRDDLQTLTSDRIARVERDVDRLSANVVPRGEHKEQWDGQRSRDEAVQRQLDDLRKALADLNTPRDTIQSIQRRLDALDRATGRRE